MVKVNPFKPNSPVSPGMFAGRLEELDRLDTHLVQTRAGNPSNFIITGERGIGKSSLMLFIKGVAQGHIPIGTTNETVKFLVIDTDIDQNTSQLGLVQKFELGLRKELARSERARDFFKDVWSFIKRIEAAGMKLKEQQKLQQDETILEEFAYSLAETVNRVCKHSTDESIFHAHYDGVLFLVDEADNGSKDLALGSFFKLLSERLQRRNCENVMFGLAGLPNLHDVLLSSHPSSLRLFEEIILGRLSDDDVNLVVDMALKKANEENNANYTITNNARSQLIRLSEGYPHFIQQFGFSAFAMDSDNEIGMEDVTSAAFGPRGALDLIGDRYYRDDFYNKIQRDSYRQVLRIMAENLDAWITKVDIRKSFKGKDSTLDNAIKALRDRHIILSKEGERGIYRLQHKGFAYWIALYTKNTADLSDKQDD
jgi:hypothetical protein